MRRLVVRTLAKQFAQEFDKECAPFQYALSTRGWDGLRRTHAEGSHRQPTTMCSALPRCKDEVPSWSRRRHRAVSGPHKLSDADPSSLSGSPSLRRLRLLLPLSLLRCRCGRPTDSFWPPPCCVRKVWSGQKGGSFTKVPLLAFVGRQEDVLNCLMRDMDLPVLTTDSRRLEVVVDGSKKKVGALILIFSPQLT